MSRWVALFVGAVLCAPISSLSAATDVSDRPTGGVRGEPTARAVVQWSEMVGQDAEPRAMRPAKEYERSRRIPRGMPIPKGALVRMETGVEAVAIQEASLLPSPAPVASFEALPNSPETEPPDTNGAVGRDHLMVMLNTEVRIQDRAGRPLSTITLHQFWQRLSRPGDLLFNPFDPRVLYDPYADRWITTAVGNFYNSLLVGVSQSGDPTGAWNLYRIDPDPLHIDFPTMGFNKDWVVVSASLFASTPPFQYSTRIWVFGKADLYAGGSGSFTSISPEPGIWGFPALTLDPSVSTLYLVQVWNGNADGNGVLRLHKITGSIGSEVLTPVAFVATPNPWSNVVTPGVPLQPGTDLCPQMGDARRITCFGGIEAVFRNGAIWAVHAIFLPAAAPTRTAIQWWQLAPDGTIVQRGRLDDPSGVRFYGFPSLAVNRSGDVLIGFSSFSEQQFASGSYAYRASGDPPSTLREERVFKGGEDSYFRDQGHGINRWGDYSASAVDPVNDTDLWTIQEYAMTRDPTNPTRGGESVASRWGTWWARVVPEPAPVDRIAPQPPARTRTPRAMPPRGQ